MTFEELKNVVRNAGIAGCGGAGFPSYAKLDKRADTIILNCAECEPLFKLHRQLLEKYSYEICSALELIREACEAKEFIVAVKAEYEDAVEAVNDTLKLFKNGKISLLPEVYPAGDEVITIYESTGRVVPAGNIPISVGVVVFNVETVLNIYNAVNNGSKVTHKYVTVAGEVKSPTTFYVPVGTSFETLIKMSGGLLRKDVTIINGGPMTGNIASKFDVVKKNTNGILILPNDNQVVLKRKANTQISAMRAKSTCCQCHSCTDLCPRYLLGHPIKPSEFMKAVSSGVTNDVPAILDTMYCVSCGICEMYACPQGLNPRSLIATFKDNMRKQGVKITPVENPEPVNPLREYRKVPMYRLKERLGLTKYDVDAPITDKEVKPKKLKIMLSQHIGAPAKSVVNKGTEIIAGDLIGKEIDNALSIPVFSPLSGTVAEANDEFVIIDVKGE